MTSVSCTAHLPVNIVLFYINSVHYNYISLFLFCLFNYSPRPLRGIINNLVRQEERLLKQLLTNAIFNHMVLFEGQVFPIIFYQNQPIDITVINLICMDIQD